jgi:hypothetical protein
MSQQENGNMIYAHAVKHVENLVMHAVVHGFNNIIYLIKIAYIHLFIYIYSCYVVAIGLKSGDKKAKIWGIVTAVGNVVVTNYRIEYFKRVYFHIYSCDFKCHISDNHWYRNTMCSIAVCNGTKKN